MALAELLDALGNLVYNCISNGGKCFLPTEHENVIAGVRLAIARLALEREARRKEGVIAWEK